MTLPVVCIIPAHNAAKTLERAVKSAYDAGCNQVIVGDDASSDTTMDVIKNLYEYYDLRGMDYHINYEVRFGATVMRNILISDLVNPDTLIICLDADDTLHDISPLVQAWQPSTWVYGNHRVMSEGQTVYHGSPVGMLSRKEVTGITFLFHRIDWLIAGGFDPDFAYAEDWAFQLALEANGVQGVYVDTVVYERYLKPEGNERTTLAGEYWQFYRNMAMRKWPSLFTVNR